MSNRSEIVAELQDASTALDALKTTECKRIKKTADTVVIQPEFGFQMQLLSRKCDQLQMILEAMGASED
ncbi:hypothetical protein [Secundilactobacillus kimchicus]|uniref:hypothetical protein n=1 Tax=Secundilactobacillus kimchicus TaxID=528209 RepID=UPI0024A8D3C2|nr:hypothetical protein [Secundilactobacillus kimchicus]